MSYERVVIRALFNHGRHQGRRIDRVERSVRKLEAFVEQLLARHSS